MVSFRSIIVVSLVMLVAAMRHQDTEKGEELDEEGPCWEKFGRCCTSKCDGLKVSDYHNHPLKNCKVRAIATRARYP
eukprot:g4017.t1